MDDAKTRCCVTAEQSFNRTLNGGCALPIAAHAVHTGTELYINGFIFEDNQSYRAHLTGDVNSPEALGRQLAQTIKKKAN